MLYGRWDYSVDSKWRVRIPKEISKHLGERVLIFEDENGCVRIENLPSEMNERHFPYVHKLSKGKSKEEKRLLIPPYLRGSISFMFENKVTLVGMGDHLEIWPRK